jgi:Kef-type K+ transport system membrane component KefB
VPWRFSDAGPRACGRPRHCRRPKTCTAAVIPPTSIERLKPSPSRPCSSPGIALSTTSVAVVYAVMVETGFNKTEIGKIILAACFINDLGTVMALGLVFANYNLWLLFFAALTIIVLFLMPRLVPWFFETIGTRVSEPDIKVIFFVLLGVGGIASIV